ncbi:DNA-(apurinic or apyrimidinic site) endonuclease 2 isoform X2 [Carya illinoinensis]|uniref:DNA-(apurinic or apyrimidinic site) endonuclease 2 isoform X2 n=1 Tax=Carya illinoinensis TaxID=32201 RepID=UPI001C71EC1C|nr:DNA-(apurinic or apyrimidinic site) endonuclease 2 isoform X2 [Carya illinoinensis]
MKIVTYNVNGLRSRISQFGSLPKLLDSFDADIICFQETKLRRQELTADLAVADGYESFFSCTRTSDRGRMGYSGVATFCRVKSAFSSTEVALPIAAQEGFTGLVENSHNRKCEARNEIVDDLEDEFAKEELLKVDSEGRCIITDHGHFVLFNLYGPRAECNDDERIQFKLTFFKILQKRWESLLRQGRRIIVVGDLNIAPTAMDCCDAGPDFETNEFRRWFRSILAESGGPFSDIFRTKHPDRREAYTCWPQNTGAEVFNYGTRIDHILCAGSCLHEDHDQQGHNLMTCHVEECDILIQYKRWKPGNTVRWKGGRSIKLEGSDHAPVFTRLLEIPDTSEHSTPALSARYIPMIHGVQQTLVSILTKRQLAEQIRSCEMSGSLSNENITSETCNERVKRSSNDCSISGVSPVESCSSNQESEGLISNRAEHSRGFDGDASCNILVMSGSKQSKSLPRNETMKKARKSQGSQLSLRSFFQRSPNPINNAKDSNSGISMSQTDVLQSGNHSDTSSAVDVQCSVSQQDALNSSTPTQDDHELSSYPLEREKTNAALLEWRRIQQVMQNSIPLCKGHSEPCVARVVKKQGPNFGRRFYVCARAEGPASNPEANCGYFKWAASKSGH